MARSRIPLVLQMTDEQFIKHLEHRHGDMMKMTFTIEPGRTERRILNRSAWETFHETIHRLAVDGRYDGHYHKARDDG